MFHGIAAFSSGYVVGGNVDRDAVAITSACLTTNYPHAKPWQQAKFSLTLTVIHTCRTYVNSDTANLIGQLQWLTHDYKLPVLDPFLPFALVTLNFTV